MAKESLAQKAILDWLAWKKIFHYRNNSGAFVSEYNGKRSFTKFGALGSPDIICVVNGRYIGLEVKAPKGKQNENQKKFQKELEKAGGIYILIHDVDELAKMLKFDKNAGYDLINNPEW